ncbi:hypothetical protein Nepgr_027240 [Nepenthes gracilis]|uniref:Uncharacterized protein n=1 Tax=Nepenthes gracilis TaxID=150966 RepID=A0AAD3TBE2_NEPGR|nr:hypothetical protein Nepgr_027240 [Nepenthes gracilis]
MPHKHYLSGQLQSHETGTSAPKHLSALGLNIAAKITPDRDRANHLLHQQQSNYPSLQSGTPTAVAPNLQCSPTQCANTKYHHFKIKATKTADPGTRAVAKRSARQYAPSTRQHSIQSTQQPNKPNTGKTNLHDRQQPR